MSKKLTGLLLAFCLIASMSMDVHADQLYGSSDWQVTFTNNNEMVDNFTQGDMVDTIGAMEPGDSALLTIHLKNDNNKAVTDWYMLNEVLYSLEDRSANTGTTGGAYTYILTYYDWNGTPNVLFSSDTVGGDSTVGGEGLHAATGALSEYFFLGTLNPSETATITLEVALDGETQGNDYQNTLADLQMRFAVELRPEPTYVREENDPDPTPTPPPTTTTIVKTGDDTNLLPYVIAMAVSGVIFLFLGIYGLRKNRKEKKEAA